MNTRPLLMTVVVATAAVLSESAWGQRDLRNIPDPDPELERRALVVHDGFEIQLFAADPLLGKPLQINFDPAGRLWVVCSELYPQIKPGETANDKVIILTDTDGDGRADQTTVFADGLLIPTGIVPGDGGCYVANSTELLHLSDTNGDGKADRKRIVLSGFGTEDTHHILHTLRWGPEGLLYMSQSIYIHSHIETPWGPRRLMGGGIWQFRPESQRLEVFARGWINTWGTHFDRYGQTFATDGAGGEGINYVVPGASYVSAVGAARILKGLNPGSPKYCGLEILSGRHIPPEWVGSLITNDFRAHRTCRFTVSDNGSGFAATQQADLISSKHVGFRPIDVKMGPDGAIYVADWYNPIIQHGEVDFRDPRRDRVHGRIWRITAQGRPLVKPPKLVGASVPELLAALAEPEGWTRASAKRLLQERGAAAVLPELRKWVANIDSAGPPPTPEESAAREALRLEALWVCQALDVVTPTEVELLDRCLASADPRVRAAATRVLSAWADRVPHALGRLETLTSDVHPRVRLEAVCTARSVPSLASVTAAVRVLDMRMDGFLDYALWQTCRELAPHWLPGVQQGRPVFGGDVGKLAFALQAVGTSDAVAPLVGLLKSGKVPASKQPEMLSLIAASGGRAELGLVLDWLANSERTVPTATRTALLVAVTRASMQRKLTPEGDLAGLLRRLLSESDVALRAAAAQAAGVWKLEPLRPVLTELAGARDTPQSLRLAVTAGLAGLGGAESRRALLELTDTARPAETRLAGVVGLVGLDVKLAAGRALEVLGELPTPLTPALGNAVAEVFEALLSRPGGSPALTAGLATVKLPADVAKLGLRSARGAGRQETALAAALTRAGQITLGTGAPRELTPEQMTGLLSLVRTGGDPARGEKLFRRNDLQCIKCHAIGGAGGLVGPSLESLGASAQPDYLVESLLVPNKAIKEGYHSLIVQTSDDRILTGVKVRQNDRELILRDAEGREIAVPLDQIEAQKNGGSLMPAGLTESLTDAELADLVRFLSELGKVGPYAIGKARYIRSWQVPADPAAAGRALRAGGTDALLTSETLAWRSLTSRVSGILPTEELPTIGGFGHNLTAARARLEVSAGGPLRLKFTPTKADRFRAYLDGREFTVAEVVTLNVTPGVHTLGLMFDPATIPDGVRVEIEEIADGGARVQVLN